MTYKYKIDPTKEGFDRVKVKKSKVKRLVDTSRKWIFYNPEVYCKGSYPQRIVKVQFIPNILAKIWGTCLIPLGIFMVGAPQIAREVEELYYPKKNGSFQSKSYHEFRVGDDITIRSLLG